jgi:hypothetical protein
MSAQALSYQEAFNTKGIKLFTTKTPRTARELHFVFLGGLGALVVFLFL